MLKISRSNSCRNDISMLFVSQQLTSLEKSAVESLTGSSQVRATIKVYVGKCPSGTGLMTTP